MSKPSGSSVNIAKSLSQEGVPNPHRAVGDACLANVELATCASNYGQDQVPEFRRGQKPRACAACSRSKLSCDKASPCGRCITRNLACRSRELPDIISTSDHKHNDTSKELLYSSSPRQSDAGMSFLKGLANPKAATMLDCFTTNPVVNENIPEMDLDMEPTEDSSPSLNEDVSFIPCTFPPFFNDQVREFRHDGDILTTSRGFSPLIPALKADGSGALDKCSETLIRELSTLHSSLSATDPSYREAFDPEVAQSVFAPHSLRNFTTTFFRLSHVYVPVVHMPSFGSEDTSTALILAVVLCGATRSPPRDDALSAKGFLRLAEEYTFRHLNELMAKEAAATRSVIEALQAALLIHFVQFLMNSVETRRRNQTQRRPTLASAVRRLGLSQTRHSPNSTPSQFIHAEACIRTTTWIMLADWHQTSMFHVPPVMTIEEIRCDLPCPRELWDTQDITEHDIELYRQQRLTSPPHYVSLKDFTEALMREHWGGMQMFPLDSLTLSGLELAVFAISSIAVSAQLTSMLPFVSSSLLRALSRWQQLWEAVTAKVDQDYLQITGMSRHCGEFCCLSQKVIKVSVSGRKLPPYLDRVGHDTVAELYNFILEH
ncbi:Transcriptional regulator MET32 [Tolypocladium capitatum]|uniref:Transcriptional regulator MET32 n=1 Tax=Tolypocladium capitatum TaxID=45235 RepID=A0A2K3QLP7_9HYPO|nr:Transcriptional regulator MET32 [Tolypocladium capitatum]